MCARAHQRQTVIPLRAEWSQEPRRSSRRKRDPHPLRAFRWRQSSRSAVGQSADSTNALRQSSVFKMCSASSFSLGSRRTFTVAVRALDSSGQPIASSMAARSPGDDRNHSPPRHREANLLCQRSSSRRPPGIILSRVGRSKWLVCRAYKRPAGLPERPILM